jgi:hypothetical protein
VNGIGLPLQKSMTITKVNLDTRVAGAAGGQITVGERSSLGVCQVTVPTSLGDSAAKIAADIAAAFQAPGVPGPNACLARANARDIVAEGDALIAVMANELVVCPKDNGVGFTLIPEELPLGAINLFQPARVLTFTADPPTITAGDTATLTWSTENAFDVNITNLGLVPPSGTAKVKPTEDTIYTITAVGQQNEASALVKVEVLPKGRPPVADAGPNQSVDRFSASLDGSKSYDPQGSPLTFSWRFVTFQPSIPATGPYLPTITGANTATPTVTLPQIGDYIFELTVTNGLGLNSMAVTRVTRIGSDP